MYRVLTLFTILGLAVAQQQPQYLSLEKFQQQQNYQKHVSSLPPQNGAPVFEQEPQDNQSEGEDIDFKQLLSNPEFIAFFREFQKQKVIQTTQAPTTFATEQTYFFPTINPPVQTTQPPVFPEFILTTPKPRRIRPAAQQPKRVQKPRKRPTTTQIPLRYESFITTTVAPQNKFESFISGLNKKETKDVPQILSRIQAPKQIKPVPNLRPTEDLSKFEESVFKKQAESAKYEFASETDDTINENFHQRQEVRDGLTVRGKYSYSDGFYKRTVHYEADDKGFRVVKEDVEPIGNGPKFNPDGHAKVSQYVAGSVNKYHITNHDVQERPTVEDAEYEDE